MKHLAKPFLSAATGSVAVLVPLYSAVAAAPAETDIRDIRGPIAVPPSSSWDSYLYASLAVAGVLIVFWKLWRWYRAREISPYRLANERLEHARASMAAGHSSVFCDEVSECVRSYIESVFHLPVTRETTDEFLAELARRADEVPALAPHKGELQGFLVHCDVAKFAGRQMSMELMTQLLERAHQFISSTQTDLQEQAKTNGRRPLLGRFSGRRNAEGTT